MRRSDLGRLIAAALVLWLLSWLAPWDWPRAARLLQWPGYKQAATPPAVIYPHDPPPWTPPSHAQGLAACQALRRRHPTTRSTNFNPTTSATTSAKASATASATVAGEDAGRVRVVTFVDAESARSSCGYARLVTSGSAQGVLVENGFPRNATWDKTLRGGARLAAVRAYLLALPPATLVRYSIFVNKLL